MVTYSDRGIITCIKEINHPVNYSGLHLQTELLTVTPKLPYGIRWASYSPYILNQILTWSMMMNVRKLRKAETRGDFSSGLRATEKGTLAKEDDQRPAPVAPTKHRTPRITTHHTTSMFINFSRPVRLWRGPPLFNIAFVSRPMCTTKYADGENIRFVEDTWSNLLYTFSQRYLHT